MPFPFIYAALSGLYSVITTAGVAATATATSAVTAVSGTIGSVAATGMAAVNGAAASALSTAGGLSSSIASAATVAESAVMGAAAAAKTTVAGAITTAEGAGMALINSTPILKTGLDHVNLVTATQGKILAAGQIKSTATRTVVANMLGGGPLAKTAASAIAPLVGSAESIQVAANLTLAEGLKMYAKRELGGAGLCKIAGAAASVDTVARSFSLPQVSRNFGNEIGQELLTRFDSIDKVKEVTRFIERQEKLLEEKVNGLTARLSKFDPSIPDDAVQLQGTVKSAVREFVDEILATYPACGTETPTPVEEDRKVAGVSFADPDIVDAIVNAVVKEIQSSRVSLQMATRILACMDEHRSLLDDTVQLVKLELASTAGMAPSCQEALDAAANAAVRGLLLNLGTFEMDGADDIIGLSAAGAGSDTHAAAADQLKQADLVPFDFSEIGSAIGNAFASAALDHTGEVESARSILDRLNSDDAYYEKTILDISYMLAALDSRNPDSLVALQEAAHHAALVMVEKFSDSVAKQASGS